MYLLQCFSSSYCSHGQFIVHGLFDQDYRVLPLLTKSHQTQPYNIRPMSNLSTISKILERLVSARYRPHIATDSVTSNRDISSWRLNRNSLAPCHGQCLHICRLKTLYRSSLLAHPCCIWLHLPRYPCRYVLRFVPLQHLGSAQDCVFRYVKMGQHSSAISALLLCLKFPQGSVLSPLLSATYAYLLCLPLRTSFTLLT